MALKELLCLSALVVLVQGGVVAAPLPYVAPYASSITSHVTHHSVAAPYVAAPPVVAAPLAAPLVTAPLAAGVVPAAHGVISPVVGAASYVL